MKKILLVLGIWVLACLIIFFSVISTPMKVQNEQRIERERIEKIKQDSIARVEFVRDSIARAEFVRDSIAKAEQNAQIINKLKGNFTHKKDEFSDRTWVNPKNSPQYRNQNGIYCYFSMINGKPTNNFRFVFQYYADDWLFIRNMIFNIDGENYMITPNMDTDCGNGGYIWEWCDVSVSKEIKSDDIKLGAETKDEDIQLKAELKVKEVEREAKYNVNGIWYIDITNTFIQKLANAKSVKVKLNGRQYYDTRTLTNSQLKTIKETYDYYIALGGTF